MIAPETVQEIQRLLANENLSNRKIAALTGVSPGTVGDIASGKRPDYDVLLQEIGDGVDEPAGPPTRCPDCGGLVYMPCRLCHARKEMANKPRFAPRGPKVEIFEPMEINLRPEHQARFEEVLARRRENNGSPRPLAGEGTNLKCTAS